MPEQALTNKTIKGVGWNTIDRISNYGIAFIVGIVLARLLSPEEYGLIGIIGIFIAIFNVVLDSGLSTALIRKDRVTESDYSTVFFTNLAFSCILTIVLYGIAPAISYFFQRPELTPYIRVMSIVLVINALSLTQQAQLTKKIDFKTQTKISVISNTVSGIIGIVMAYFKFGVWALVAQQISSRILVTVLFWIYNKWIPRLLFSWQSFKELFGFSWKLLLAQIIHTTWNQVYQVVIGKVYNPSTLGQFTRANQYVTLASNGIGDVVLKVSLPVMSSIQNDDERLLRAYKKIIKATMFITFLVILWMAASAKSLIFVLIGEQWLPCVPMMQILCFSLMLNPLMAININMLTLQGRSDLQLYLQIVKCILAVGPILLGIYVGIYWMLAGSVLMSLVSLLLNSYYSGKKYDYTWWMQLKDITPSFFVALLMAIPVFLLSFLSVSLYVILPFQIVGGILLTIIICELVNLPEYKGMKTIILDFINSRFKGFQKWKRKSDSLI